MNRADQSAIIREIPWLTWHELAAWPCDALRWKYVAVRDLHPWGAGCKNPPRGIQERAKCRNLAHYEYWLLTPMLKRDGTRGDVVHLCWSHFTSSGLYRNMDEETRTDAWLRQHHPEVFSQAAGHVDS